MNDLKIIDVSFFKYADTPHKNWLAVWQVGSAKFQTNISKPTQVIDLANKKQLEQKNSY